jgi:AbrB family looped-hinge helix DNA binding protein
MRDISMDKNFSAAKTAETLFCRPEGATMDEVIAATGGPQYNVLRRLEAKGYAVRKVREGRGTRYFVVPPASPVYELTVSERGQVVLPKELRDKLGIGAGRKLSAEIQDGKIVLAAKSSNIMDLVGILHRPGMRPRTQQEIDDAIKAGAVGRVMRGLKRAGQ